MANIGYPIIEADNDGRFSITKHEGTGGRVSVDIIKEQLLYELGDPKNYITPDCVADFTSIQLKDAGPDRVQVSGIRGAERPQMLKLSIAYSYGWKAIGTLVYSAPQALEKSKAADRIVRERLQQLGLKFEEIYTEFFGVNACHGPVAVPESRSAGGATAHRRARPGSESRRSLHARVDPAGAERTSDGHRLRGWASAGARGGCLLAGVDPARIDPDLGGGGGMKIPLSRIAHARSGDKGDTSNIGIIAFDARHYPLLVREVTGERVKHFFGEMVKGDVERYELPNLGALNFLLHEALGGGGTLSLRIDAQGKTLGAALLRMEIEVSEENWPVKTDPCTVVGSHGRLRSCDVRNDVLNFPEMKSGSIMMRWCSGIVV